MAKSFLQHGKFILVALRNMKKMLNDETLQLLKTFKMQNTS